MVGEALLVLVTPHLCPEAVPQLSLAWALRFAAVAAVNLQVMVWCRVTYNCVEHQSPLNNFSNAWSAQSRWTPFFETVAICPTACTKDLGKALNRLQVISLSQTFPFMAAESLMFASNYVKEHASAFHLCAVRSLACWILDSFHALCMTFRDSFPFSLQHAEHLRPIRNARCTKTRHVERVSAY
jgi:hypothetical protein